MGSTLRHRRSRGRRSVAVIAAFVLGASAMIAGDGTAALAYGGLRAHSALPGASNSNGTLNMVSCASDTSCLALGSYFTAAGDQPVLAERWNGHAWGTVPAPADSIGPASVLLSDVACPLADRCLAVGSLSTVNRTSETLAELWEGTTWSVLAAPVPNQQSGFNFVSCGGPTACMVVGTDQSSAGPTLFSDTWNGTGWAPRPMPEALSMTIDELDCVSANACIAVGSNYDGGSGNVVPAAEAWNGRSWAVVPVPTPAGTTFGTLQVVGCAKPARCLAVGSYSTNTNPGANLADTWNGRSWTAVAAPPNPRGTSGTFLGAVSCRTATSCIAVGSASIASSSVALAESWNGRGWTALPLRPTGSVASTLQDVSCSAGGSCVAVGNENKTPGSSITSSLGAVWDGTRLAITPTPDATSPTTQLSRGIQWISRSCPDSSAENEQATDPKLGYVYVDWIGCGSPAIAFVRSTDGGRTFSKPILMTGPTGSFNTWDPAVSVAPDGTVYASYMADNANETFAVVEVSHDHGATFSTVTDLVPPGSGNFGDRDFVAAGPNGTVYVTWDYGPSGAEVKTLCFPGGSCSFSNGDLNIVVQKSTDYGRTFGPMVHVSTGYPAGGADAGPLFVEPGGRVDVLYQALSVTNLKTLALGPGHEWFTSSTDGGASWSKPVEVGPSSGTESLDEWWIDGDIGIDAGGNLYATWDTQGSEDVGWLAWSTDHGRSWSAPVRVTPDHDKAVHIVQVAGGRAGQADVGWLTNASPLGYALWLQPYSIAKGWLGGAVRASLGTYGTGTWPGDTFGLSDLGPTGAPPGQECVSASWGGGVLRPLGDQQGDMFAANTSLGDEVSPLCPTLPGYRVESATGALLTLHQTDDGSLGRGTGVSDAVGLAATPAGGYWIVGSDGGVFALGAKFYGSLPAAGIRSHDVVGAASTADGRGYWLATAQGAVYRFGDARPLGSLSGRRVAAPIVGIAATPDGRGYWLAGADGGVFAFGDARFRGSMAGRLLGAPVVGIAATRDGAGYWLVAKDGGVFGFGTGTFHGSCPSAGSGCGIVDDVVGIAGSAGGNGYWLAGADGGVFAFGDAQYFGAAVGARLGSRVVGITG